MNISFNNKILTFNIRKRNKRKPICSETLNIERFIYKFYKILYIGMRGRDFVAIISENVPQNQISHNFYSASFLSTNYWL